MLFGIQAKQRTNTNNMQVPMFLPLLLMEMVIRVMADYTSVQVISYKKSRKTQDGPVMCAMDEANETISSSSVEDCSLTCARDGTCTGFNIKNSLTSYHINTAVLASTSRTHSSVTCTSTNRAILPL